MGVVVPDHNLHADIVSGGINLAGREKLKSHARNEIRHNVRSTRKRHAIDYQGCVLAVDCWVIPHGARRICGADQ